MLRGFTNDYNAQAGVDGGGSSSEPPGSGLIAGVYLTNEEVGRH